LSITNTAIFASFGIKNKHTMEWSLFIARTFGIIYLSIGIGLLLFKETYLLSLRKVLDQPGYALLGGFLAVFLGMAILTVHNLWVPNWQVLITAIGWIALIKGMLLLIFPGYIGLFKSVLSVKNKTLLTLGILLLGLLLTYLGFFY